MTPIRFVTDEDFHGYLTEALPRLASINNLAVDVVRVQDREVGLSGESDTAILLWASRNNRVVLTHDRTTMPYTASTLVAEQGLLMKGMIVVARPRDLPASRNVTLRELAEDILIEADDLSDPQRGGWDYRIRYLP
ncbi:MAG: DUF5615 family PIN-like protein [Acidimicrobiia bacterium]|nr:DUF5615 family PIN-like protein [Acidimicrobiia bacterium]